MTLNLFGLVINDNNTDVCKLRAGGLDGLAVFTGGHNRVGVAVYDKVDAGDLFIEVDGAIAVGCRLGINAQVADADDKVSLLLL